MEVNPLLMHNASLTLCLLSTTKARDQLEHRVEWNRKLFITKTCLYNFDPLKSHFYIVKLGFTGVYIIFLISAQNIDCGYSLEPPHRGGSNEYTQSMFLIRSMKNIRVFYQKILSFWR